MVAPGPTVLGLLPTLPTLPFEQPVVVLTVALASFFVAPILVERAGLPGVVGIVLAGTALGPNVLGVLEHGDAIVLLGNAGLVYLLFTVGLELDLRRFFNAPEDAALFGLTSFGLPFVVGTVVCIYVLGFDAWGAMLLSAVFASHTLLAYPIVNSLDVTKTAAVTAVFGGILFTDTLALVVLAVVLGVIEGGLTVGLVAGVVLALLVLFGGIGSSSRPSRAGSSGTPARRATSSSSSSRRSSSAPRVWRRDSVWPRFSARSSPVSRSTGR